MWAHIALKRSFGAGLTQVKSCISACHGKAALALSSLQLQRNQYSSEVAGKVSLNPPSVAEPYSLSEEQQAFITKCDPVIKAKLSELQLKLFVKREQGCPLPPEIKIDEFAHLLNMGARQLSRTIDHLTKCCKREVADTIKKQKSREKLELIKKEREMNKPEVPWLHYVLHKNALFPRVFKSNMSRYYDAHALKISQFAQKVIIDCSFESHMDEMRLKHTAKQIVFCYVYNRKERRPFALHMCNVNPDSRLMFYINKIHTEFSVDTAVFLHSSSYLELFNRKQLVYLTPHTKTSVVYDPNDIYILGAIVDRDIGLQLSNRKAAKEKIRYASLPLDKYLTWKKGTKNLCIHQCFGALLDVKNNGDWETALLKHVPPRKIHDELYNGK